jgi:hypothetical protein
MQTTDAAAEWCLLQNQFDSYEKHSLFIKLSSALILSLSVVLDRTNMTIACLLAILWLQDAIWKTFQSRIEHRLLKLEAVFAEEAANSAPSEKPFQFNSDYLRSRGGSLTLIREYISQSIRPTVAFPHVALLALCLLTQVRW